MKNILKQIDILHVFLLGCLISIVILIGIINDISEENKILYKCNKNYKTKYIPAIDSLNLLADTVFQKLKNENASLKKILEK